MKFRRIIIFGLTLVLAGSLTAFAACSTSENQGGEPPEYSFEDGRPDGELAAPDEGFEIDGVLDEAAYNNIRWLEGPVLRPYYTSDGQGVYYDYDVIQERAEDAAQVKMGTYYGENGVYIAYSYQEQAGKVCYVNPSRKSYRNSGVELHIGIPSSVTMTGDETISRLTVNANGALTIAKTQGDIWMAPYGTEDHANMPYVGLTAFTLQKTTVSACRSTRGKIIRSPIGSCGAPRSLTTNRRRMNCMRPSCAIWKKAPSVCRLAIGTARKRVRSCISSTARCRAASLPRF